MTKAELTKLLKGAKVKDLREKLLEMEMEIYYDSGSDAAEIIRDALTGDIKLQPLPRTRKGIIDDIASWIGIDELDDEDVFSTLNDWGFVTADDEK